VCRFLSFLLIISGFFSLSLILFLIWKKALRSLIVSGGHPQYNVGLLMWLINTLGFHWLSAYRHKNTRPLNSRKIWAFCCIFTFGCAFTIMMDRFCKSRIRLEWRVNKDRVCVRVRICCWYLLPQCMGANKVID